MNTIDKDRCKKFGWVYTYFFDDTTDTYATKECICDRQKAIKKELKRR